jgi:hypothetical protein
MAAGELADPAHERERSAKRDGADVEAEEQRVLTEARPIRLDDREREEDVGRRQGGEQAGGVAEQPQYQALDLPEAEAEADDPGHQKVGRAADRPGDEDQQRELEDVVEAEPQAVHAPDRKAVQRRRQQQPAELTPHAQTRPSSSARRRVMKM